MHLESVEKVNIFAIFIDIVIVFLEYRLTFGSLSLVTFCNCSL